MSNPSFHLFGLFEAADHVGEHLHFPTTKAQALLAYLLVEEVRQPGISHQRGKLMTLLWPDITPESAQTNLRQTLYRVRKLLPIGEAGPGQMEPLLISDRQSVKLNPAVSYWLDVAEFEHALREADEESEEGRMASLVKATALYRGHFLADVSVPDSEYFEQWAMQIREELRRKTVEALQQIGEDALKEEEWDQAQAAARRQIALDELNEAAYRQLMLAQAMAGQRNKALTEFTALKQLLEDELGVEPLSETTMLAAAIRDGKYEREVTPVASQQVELESDSAGRQAELILLDKVNRFWVKGVLEHSLTGAPLLELGMETVPTALAAPWEMVVGQPVKSGRLLPAGTSIKKLFNDSGQAVLILGEPGAGKTTTLLELARVKIEEAKANSAAPLPVVLNLRSWAEKSLPITRWLIEELNIKYLIPTKIGRTWVEHGRLLLLLDGLDEVRIDSQAACVTAINTFRQENGLVQIAVSSRVRDYEAIPGKLRLSQAIKLLPLDGEQAQRYLQENVRSHTGLINILERDSRLANLAQSPLMLNIMALTFQGDKTDDLVMLETAEGGRQQLLATYVEQMFQRRGKRDAFPPTETKGYLGWLARSLIEKDQTVFLLEQLQPSWLQLDRSRWIYALTTRVVVSVFIGFGFIIGFVEPALEEFSLPAVGAMLLTSLLMGIVLGSFAAIRFKRQLTAGEGTVSRNYVWSMLARLVAVGLLTLLVTSTIFLAFGFDVDHTGSVAYINAVIYALIFGVKGRRRSVDGDIRPVETVIWSWARGLSGCIPGLVVGVVLGVIDQYVTSDMQQNSVILAFAIIGGLLTGLVGGLRRGAVGSQDRPNNGIYLSLRYGVRVGSLFGLVAAVAFMVIFRFDPINAAYRWTILKFSLRIGFTLGSWALLWYGGIEVIYHAVLRILLRCEGSITPRYTDFLEHAVDLIFLRRVGGGYIFVHQLLHNYFARHKEI
ncbi:MAG: BTAD domain-containing putative transcriptional regulator [Candidatus Promineifilaceae bacterium]|nr:BTAD domain-containing putative transcriptional regulator [Candidatus Promineifilaceae bacterium]